MELDQEIYLWMANICNFKKDISQKLTINGTIIIPEIIYKKLQDGLLFKLIIKKIEDQYNQFYKINLNYSSALSDIKIAKDLLTREENWKLISEALINFGIDFSSRLLSDIVNSKKEALQNLIKNLFILSSELLKNRDFSQSNLHTEIKNSPENFTEKSVIKEAIDITDIDCEKEMTKAESCLEFFMLSLSKSLEMKPRQSAALLSNNRKYLIQIANKGIKGDYSKIIIWFETIQENKDHLLHLMKYSNEESNKLSLALLSVGFYSRNYNVSFLSCYLINILLNELNLSKMDWFLKEGIDAILFCINKHSLLRVSLINLIGEFSRDELSKTFKELLSRLQEKQILSFIENIISVLKEANPLYLESFKNFIYDFCRKGYTNNDDKAYQLKSKISLISQYWIEFSDSIDEDQSQEILLNLKQDIRETDKKINQKVAIIELLRVFKVFAIRKEKLAPTLYKNLVFLFLEFYSDINIRELFITQFTNIFFFDQSIPVKIFLEPYLRQLKNSSNYSFIELQFILKISDHPKFDQSLLKEIYEFLCFINLSNLFYNKITRVKIAELIQRYPLNHKQTEFIIDFIRNSLRLYNETKESIFIDSLYDIVRLNNLTINNLLEEVICDNIYINREQKGYISLGLLSILWFFDSHDDVLLKLDEKYAPKYDSTQKNREKKLNIIKEDFIENIKDNKQKIKEIITKRQEDSKKTLKEEGVKKKVLKKQVEERLIDQNQSQPSRNDISSIKNQSVLIKDGGMILNKVSLQYLIPLENEEKREKIAIDNICVFYKKNLHYYFNKYLTETNGSMKKSNYLKFFRELQIDNDTLTLDDISSYIRVLFNAPLNNLNFDQFLISTYHLAHFIECKTNTNLSISQSFELFCKLLNIPKISKEDKEILSLLETRYSLNTNIPLPPGFTKLVKKKVEYEYKLPYKIQKIYGEKKVICYEILDDLISKAFDTHIIEPKLKLKEVFEIAQTGIKPKWSLNTFIAYTKMNSVEFDKGNIIDVTYLIEEMLGALEKGKQFLETPTKKIHPKEIEEMNEKMINCKLAEDQEKKRKIRQQIIKREVEEMKRKKEEEKTKKEEEIKKEKLKVDEKNKIILLKDLEIRKKMKEELKQIKSQKDSLLLLNAENEKKKIEEFKKEKEKERGDFLLKQKRKLKNQFMSILEEKKKSSNVVEEQLPDINIKRVFEKDKNFIEFEKNLYSIAQNLVNRMDLKEVFKEYENHFTCLFEIYSKFGQKKLGSLIEEVIAYHQFKEFCLDFNILGILINTEQMQYIFHKVCLSNDVEKEDKKCLKFNDFLVAFILLCLYSKYTNKSRKLIPEDVNKIDRHNFKSFIEFIGLKLPFSKKQIEDYIIERRNLTTKQELNLKKSLLPEIKNINEKIKEQESINRRNREAILSVPKVISPSQKKKTKVNSISRLESHKNNLNIPHQNSRKNLVLDLKTKDIHIKSNETQHKKVKNANYSIPPTYNSNKLSVINPDILKEVLDNEKINDSHINISNNHVDMKLHDKEIYKNVNSSKMNQLDNQIVNYEDTKESEEKDISLLHNVDEKDIENRNELKPNSSKANLNKRPSLIIRNKIEIETERIIKNEKEESFENIMNNSSISKLKNKGINSDRCKSSIRKQKIEIDDIKNKSPKQEETRGNMNVIGPNGEQEIWEIKF